MGFTFHIGSNYRPAGEVGIDKIDKTIIRSPRGTRQYRRELWDLSGQIQVSATTDMDAAMLEFERQLQDGRDVKFVNERGSKTAHEIRSSETTNGVLINNLQWGASEGAEHSVFRSYKLQLEATFRIAGFGDLLDFRETITFQGGGPRNIWIELSSGDPEKQPTNKKTTYKAIQSGSAVGEFRRPSPPDPIWPAFWHQDRRIVEPTSPTLMDGVFSDFGIRWQYEFESNRPLVGVPHQK